MWFRLFTVSLCVALFAFLGWMSSHESSTPAVLGRYSGGYFALLLGIAAIATVSLLAQWPCLYQRLHQIRWKLALAIVSMLLSLVLVEITVRVFDPCGVSYFQEASRYHLDKVPDPVLVYKHAPGLRRIYQDVTVEINELGMRDRKLEGKESGELRILLLGDSVTFGWGVPIESTFGRKLEGRLAAKVGRPVRAVNTGVGSYNTVQELAVLKTFADMVDPDLVILLFVSNDIESNDPPFDPWSQRSLQGKSPPEAITLLLGKSWFYRLGHFAVRYSRSNGPTSLDKHARGVTESMASLSAMAAFCRDHKFQFVTFYYRPKSDPAPERVSPLLSEVQTIGQNHGFPVADVGTWWGNVDMRSVTNSIVDSHPNDRGHEILAAGMADFLVTHDLVNATVDGAR